MIKFIRFVTILIIIISAFVGVYFLWQSNTGEDPVGLVSLTGNSVLESNDNNQITDQTQVLITALSRATAINSLDVSVFENPLFLQLDDISIALPVDPNPGRINPFQKIGDDITE